MARPRLTFEHWPTAVYAVGDVHGCLSQLLAMERRIAADAAALRGDNWIVMLGVYVDRGPQSAQVIAHLLRPPPDGLRRFCLAGNHEMMMLEFLDGLADPAYWLNQGGRETLRSYRARGGAGEPELEPSRPEVPETHTRFLRSLPISLSLPGWAFVHAGIRPGIALADQTEEDLAWIREPFLSSTLRGAPRIVHGHTPRFEPVVTPYRVGLDTGCFQNGRLTAARITEDGELTLFTASGERLDAAGG